MADPVPNVPTRLYPPEPSALLSLPTSPLLVSGMILQVVRDHFSDRNHIDDPALRGHVWGPDNATGILIENWSHWQPELLEKRPAVIVRRHDWNTQRQGINDQNQGLLAADGADRFTTFMVGSTTLFCLAQAGGEAEKLAFEVAAEVMKFGPVIRQDLGFQRFTLASIGEPFIVEEARAHVAVPVTVAHAHEQSWVIRNDRPPIKTIAWSFSLMGL